MAKTSDSNFESSLVSLEQVVAQLESGDLPLERALALFEEGVGLARVCQSQLEEAERKVELLLRERGEIKTVPFDSSNSTGNSTGNSTDNAAGDAAEAAEPGRTENRDDVIPF